MNKKFISVFAFVLAAFMSFASLAQETSPSVNINIALINLKKVESESIAWKSLSEQINARREKLKAEIQAMQSSLEGKAGNLESQRTLLSAESFALEVESFKKERAALDQTVRSRKQNLDKAFLEARGQIRKAVNKVMLQIVQEKKISLVLKAGEVESSVYFATSNMFINDAVLALLNKEIQTVVLPAETPAQ